MTIFNDTDAIALRAPHVSRAFFLELALPSGTVRYHTGYGKIEIDGVEWIGAADPIGGRLVTIGRLTQSTIGKAIDQTIVLSGADSSFVRSVRDTAAQIEGAAAAIYFCLFDPETEGALTDLKLMSKGHMTSPKRSREGSVRQISLTLESVWSVLNFPGARRWNGADQRRLYPGDAGLDLIGVDVKEQYQ